MDVKTLIYNKIQLNLKECNDSFSSKHIIESIMNEYVKNKKIKSYKIEEELVFSACGEDIYLYAISWIDNDNNLELIIY